MGHRKAIFIADKFETKATFHSQPPPSQCTPFLSRVRFLSMRSFSRPSVLEKQPSLEQLPPSYVHGYICPEDSHFEPLFFFPELVIMKPQAEKRQIYIILFLQFSLCPVSITIAK